MPASFQTDIWYCFCSVDEEVYSLDYIVITAQEIQLIFSQVNLEVQLHYAIMRVVDFLF